MWILWTLVAIILRMYVFLLVKPHFVRKMSTADRSHLQWQDYRNQLQKRTLLAGSRGCRACVDCCCFIWSKLQQFCWCSCTSLTLQSPEGCFSDFLDVCSSLAPISSNFSLVSTRSYVFVSCILKSPVVLNLFTKLWIVCLLGTLSWRNLRRNFLRHFLADPYFTYVSEIHVALKYTSPWCTTLLTNWNWEKMANEADNCCLLLINHKGTPTHDTAMLAVKHNAVKRITSSLLLFIPNVIGHYSCWFIGKFRTRLVAGGAPVAVKR
jgi:hypothetical protein